MSNIKHKPQNKDCKCFFCRTKVVDGLIALARQLNEEEKDSMANRILITKVLVKVLVGLVEMNLVSRTGLLEIVKSELIAEAQMQMAFNMAEEIVAELEKEKVDYIA